MPRLNLVIFAGASAVLLAFNRWLAQRLRTSRFGRPRVLLIGNPDDVDLTEKHLASTDRDALVVGRSGDADDLLQGVSRTGATDVLLLGGVELGAVYPEPLSQLEELGVGLYRRLLPSDTLLGVTATRQIAGVPFVPLRAHALPASKAHFKRLLDVLYLVIVLPVALLLGLVLAVFLLVVEGRPILYRQTRVGRDGEQFTMIKFRTMYLDSERETGAVLAERDDPRVVRGLGWLRSTRLDELPQVWNVVRGEMALVGPRPERPELAEQYATLIPGYGRRHDVRPGITGLAQINGDYHTDPAYKLGHDLQYLVNWSPALDLQIMARTLLVVLRRSG